MANIHSFNDNPQMRASQAQGDPLDGLECLICVDKPINPIMTKCGHVFCYGCIDNWLKRTVGRVICPTCREDIDRSTMQPVLNPDSAPPDDRYEEPQDQQEQISTFGLIWNGIVGIFMSGFGILTVLKFLNLGRYFGDRQIRRDPNAPFFEGERERLLKIGLVFIFIFMIFLKLAL